MEFYTEQLTSAREYVANNRLENAFAITGQVLKKFDNLKSCSKKLISLQRRDKDVRSKVIAGVLSENDYNVEKNKITSDFLDLTYLIIDEINETTKGTPDNSERLVVSESKSILSLKDHLGSIGHWANEISFKDLRGAKDLEDVYIEIDITLTPKRLHIEKQISNEETFKIQDLLPKYENIAILGDPGAGKTTTLKFICFNYFLNNKENAFKYQYPVLIRLRQLREYEFLYDRLADCLGIFEALSKLFAIKNNFFECSDNEIRLIRKIINFHLSYFNILVLLDGFDELNQFKQIKISDEIESLLQQRSNTNLILTCRSGAYNFNFENINPYELCDLGPEQVEEFAQNWLKDSQSTSSFLEQLYKSPFKDTSVRPLVMAHLCALYERYKRIPDKPKSVYKKIVILLLEEWDSQRGIVRGSKYASFDIDRKQDFLSELAFELTIRYDSKVYSKRNFKEVYKDIYPNYGLNQDESNNVLIEIEAHNGIIIQSSFDTFEFSHKSLQEYLSAEYIVRMHGISYKTIIDRNIYNELAIAVCLSSNPSQYFCYLVFDVFRNIRYTDKKYINEFLTRLFQENPDFYISDSIIVAFFHLYNKFYLNDAESITDCMSSYKTDNDFYAIYNKFQLNKSFKQSMFKFKENIVYNNYYLEEHGLENVFFIEIETPSVGLQNQLFQNAPSRIFIDGFFLYN